MSTVSFAAHAHRGLTIAFSVFTKKLLCPKEGVGLYIIDVEVIDLLHSVHIIATVVLAGFYLGFFVWGGSSVET